MESVDQIAIGWRMESGVPFAFYPPNSDQVSTLNLILNYQFSIITCFYSKKNEFVTLLISIIFTPNKLNMIMGDFDNKEREEVFSKKVRAGKRTYFFDVKATRSNDYYVTVTESKKRLEDGVFIKHKIFLYKEDFEKFAEGLKETIDYIKAHQEVVEKRYEYSENNSETSKENDDFSFEI